MRESRTYGSVRGWHCQVLAYATMEENMIALIAAFAKNRVIGNKGCIPWKIKGEQKRFRELTTGNVVVMGRRSYEEILPFVEKMYITEIDCDIEGDTYFPSFDKEQFVKEINEKYEGEIPYTYVTYIKR